MSDLKVIVADDSGLMRLIISDILNSADGITVVDTAVDGRDAYKKVLSQPVDVLVLDVNMGTFGGKYAVEKILTKRQTPILLLSAVGNSNMEQILEILRLGAADFLNKPDKIKNNTTLRELGIEIINKVKSVAKLNKAYLNNNKKEIKRNNSAHTFNDDSKLSYSIIAIGASTGGPTAIERIISKLPKNLPLPVVVVQHMPANFIPSFANRLNTLTDLTVKVMEKDEVPQPSHIYIAPGGVNVVVRVNEKEQVVFDETTELFKEFNHTSVDGLFLSIAEVYGKRTIAAILTGMGKDGVKGIGEIYKKGGYTIAQDEKTCAVYGMPKRVVENGYANSIVSIEEMAGFMVSCIA